jgi:hypothetical protein
MTLTGYSITRLWNIGITVVGSNVLVFEALGLVGVLCYVVCRHVIHCKFTMLSWSLRRLTNGLPSGPAGWMILRLITGSALCLPIWATIELLDRFDQLVGAIAALNILLAMLLTGYVCCRLLTALPVRKALGLGESRASTKQSCLCLSLLLTQVCVTLIYYARVYDAKTTYKAGLAKYLG